MLSDLLHKRTRWLIALWSASALAGEAPLALEGSAAYHRLNVPLAVLAQTSSPDLRDIRVLNARGEPVPYAWADEPARPVSEEREQRVPFFQAPAAASATTAAQQGGWVIDVRGVNGALLELALSVSPQTHGLYDFVLEYSDNLQRWRTHLHQAQLLSLQHQGLRLEHTRFDLGGLRARYLRLRPATGSQPPPLTGARVRSVSHYQAAPPLQWSDAIAPKQCTPQYCDYLLPRHLPLEQLEWQLADANTLASVDVLAQYDNSVAPNAQTPRHRHHLRGHLHGLRDKTAPDPSGTASTPVWSALTRTTAYWLRLPQGEVRSQPLVLDAGLVTQLRLQPAGGMVQLGAKPPTLRVGARAASLVFLARQPAPYRLAWGGEATPTALTLAQLMPTRQVNDALPAETASVVMPALPAVVAAPASAAASAAAPAPVPSRKFWLWAVLLGALGLMGLMAWSLLRPRPDANATKP